MLLCFYLAPVALRLPILFVASLIFYAVSGLVPLYFLVGAITWGWSCAYLSKTLPRWLRTVIALSVPMGCLFTFKYLGFSLDTFGVDGDARATFLSILAISLPAGISFYTFQIASYNLDILDQKFDREGNFIKFGTYISAFPQLIAGPIVRYGDMAPQLNRIATQDRLEPDYVNGLKFIAFGLFGKVFAADILGMFHGNYLRVDFLVRGTAPDALFVITAYSFQIYYDFWAYSLMAIGIGRLFAINLPINFNEPYIALNPKDFWRRWHITLSAWLRDYVYLKLGGNKSYIRNIFIVFAVTGLWHGAGWNFVVWGLYHAVLVLGYHLCQSGWDRMPSLVQRLLTFFLVTLGWPLFFADVSDYLVLLSVAATGDWDIFVYGIRHWIYLGLIAAVTFGLRERWWLYNESYSRFFDSPVLHGAVLILPIAFLSFSGTFIYFRF